MNPDQIDRAAGCIVGAFVGDALGLGPHWYYDLKQQHADYGTWVDGYTDPKPHRYHGGMKAGELPQTGLIMQMLLRSVAEKGGYDEPDFCRRLDEELLPFIDGNKGPGGYTNHSMRQVWEARIRQGKPWGETAGHADTSEGAERVSILAAHYARDPRLVARTSARNVRLSQNDSLVVQQSVAFSLVLAALIRGEKLDETLSDKLMDGIGGDGVPFLEGSAKQAGQGDSGLNFPSPDALLLPSWVAESAHDPEIQIEPAWKVAQLYGMSCAINFLLPASYYLAVRFSDDFESAVLHALNGGGQNMSRACLTGALVGAQVGLSGIPVRFIQGLQGGEEICRLAKTVAGN